MKTGALAGTIYGNEWQMVYDSGELAAAVTSLTISNLNGDTDKEYRIISRLVSGAANTNFYVRPNNDAGTGTYGEQWINGANTTLAAYRQTTGIGFYNHYELNASGQVNFADLVLYAKSGYIRSGITKYMDGVVGGAIVNVGSVAGCWNNTADNITSIVIAADQTNGLGIGSRFILLRRADRDASTIGKTGKINAYGKIKGCFQKIYENDILSATTSVTVSGLDGNTDVLYRAVVRLVDGSGLGGGTNCVIRYNNDAGANYFFQHATGYYTAPFAGSTAFNGDLIAQDNVTTGSIEGFGEKLIFAKSGYVRTSLARMIGEYASGDVNYAMLLGNVWSNTADNITSMVFYSGQTNGFGVGSHIELWAYRP